MDADLVATGAAKRSVLVVVVVAVLALIVVDAVRRVVDAHPRPDRVWPLIVLAAFAAYTIGVFVYLRSARGRARLERRGAASSVTQLTFLALALTPVVVSVAAVFLGAPLWSLWVCWLLTCVLAAWAMRPTTGDRRLSR